MNRSCVACSFVIVLAFATEGFAQVQSSSQQSCLNRSSGSARKVTTSAIKVAVDCLKRGAVSHLPAGTTAEECLHADLKGLIGKARAKVDDYTTRYCTPPPDFGFIADSAAVSDYHESEAISLVPDCFGPDLDAALAGSLASDDKAACSAGVLQQSGKVADTMLKTYLACVKAGLKEETITSDAGLDACMDAIVTDARGRVAKAVSRVQAKLVSSSCPASPASLFSELDGPGELCDRYGLTLPLDAASLTTCLRNRIRCRMCRTINGAAGLDRDCELFDDGSVDATCPACANGLQDPGEGCDDGNLLNGDGCTSQCVVEFCGDGVQNNSGTEECDNGGANSDTTPNACRTNCELPSCGDGVVDNLSGEQCDEGGVNTATCDSNCTLPVCGDGLLNTASGEQCDDGNASNTDACVGTCQNATCGDGFVRTGVEDCDGGECCAVSCDFATLGTPCTGSGGDCTAPQCNGAGSCDILPAHEGETCDDGQVCTAVSTCQSGTCSADTLSGVGELCDWVVVGSDTNSTTLKTAAGAQSIGGDWCGLDGDFDANTVFSEDIVTTGFDGTGRAIQFAADVTVNGGDIIANNARVETLLLGPDLPGLTGVKKVDPGQHVSKSPSPTFYDTTGNDSRIAKCQDAQAAIHTIGDAVAALTATADFDITYKDIAVLNPPPITAVNVGGLNVFDMKYLSGTVDGVTITLDGGGSANTVMVLRISTRLNSAENWIFNLTGGLTPDHLLFYVSKTTGTEGCAIGINNVGAGTLLCPDQQVHINPDTVWTGALYGGDSGADGELRLESATLNYAPFTAALP